MNKKVLLFLVGSILVIGGGLLWLQNFGSERTSPLLEVSQTSEVVFGQYTEDTLAQYRGKPLVVNVWASWCPFCLEELKDFALVQRELGGQVVILAVNRQESLAQAKRFTDELGVTDDLIFLLDADDAFYRKVGGFSMPETVFYDRQGNVKIHKRGPVDAQELREKLKEIL